MRVTALLAHPDDELMCAGTLARLTDRHDVTLATLFVDERHDEWEACAKVLDLTLMTSDFDEDDFVWSRRTVRLIEDRLPPADLWITHRADDANTSHGHIGRIARTLARKNYASVWEIDQSLPGGIVPGAPNLFVSIDPDVSMRACNCYRSQVVTRYPSMREAIQHRNALYGWQMGVDAAEGFTVHKAVWL